MKIFCRNAEMPKRIKRTPSSSPKINLWPLFVQNLAIELFCFLMGVCFLGSVGKFWEWMLL